MITRRQLLAGALSAPLGAAMLSGSQASAQAKYNPDDWREIPLAINRDDDAHWPLLRYCQILPVTQDKFLYLNLDTATKMLPKDPVKWTDPAPDGDDERFRYCHYTMPWRYSFPCSHPDPTKVAIYQQVAHHKAMTIRTLHAQAALRTEQSWGDDRITIGERLTEQLINLAFETVAADTKARTPFDLSKQDMRLVINPEVARELGWGDRETVADIPLVIDGTYSIHSDGGKDPRKEYLLHRDVYLLCRPGGARRETDFGPSPATFTAFTHWDAVGQETPDGKHWVGDHVGFAVTSPLTGWWFRSIET